MDTNKIIENAKQILEKLGLATPSQINEAIAASYGITGIGTVNNEVDAFRHAYTSAVATYLMGEGIAKAVGDYNEDRLGEDNPPKERNMDLWNNDIGREIGKTASSIEEIGQRVAEAIKSGQTINGIDDTRQWTEPAQQPEISIPDILTHPLGRLITGFFRPIPGTLIAQIGAETLVELVRSLFTTAAFSRIPTSMRIDPLAVDLDGDGIETTNVKDGAYFDHDGNGFSEQSGWVSQDDGLLVMDRDGNGTIDSGKELFGDQTILNNGSRASNGFEALTDLDENHDGKIDSNDAAFSQLKVWQDIDGDGYSSADELHSLNDVGIKSINLNSTISNIADPQGNTLTRTGAFEKTDGTTGQIANYNFRRDTAYTIANEWLDVPEDIAALPDLQGYGNVYDLQQAVAREQQAIGYRQEAIGNDILKLAA